jgi:hypothetical protein
MLVTNIGDRYESRDESAENAVRTENSRFKLTYFRSFFTVLRIRCRKPCTGRVNGNGALP